MQIKAGVCNVNTVMYIYDEKINVYDRLFKKAGALLASFLAKSKYVLRQIRCLLKL